MNEPSLLVHLHVYYTDQLDWFLEKLASVNACRWDLYVTISSPTKEILNKIYAFKPDAIIVTVSNRGYDIWPFLCVLYKVDLSKYDYVLKLHTKQLVPLDTVRPADPDIIWRNCLVDALLKSPTHFKRLLALMDKNSVGLCAAGHCFFRRHKILNEDGLLYQRVSHQLGCRNSSHWFVAGTMFLIKADCLKQLQQNSFAESEFPTLCGSNSRGTLAHAIERIFIPLVLEKNLKIYPVNWPKLSWKRFFHYCSSCLGILFTRGKNREQQQHQCAVFHTYVYITLMKALTHSVFYQK